MFIKKVSAITLSFLFLAFMFTSCNVASIKPKAVGKPGQILVVAETNTWEGVVGEAFREYFIQPYPVLPQPEPFFDLKFVSGSQLKDLQREVRTIIFLGAINDINSTSQMIKQSIGNETYEKAKGDLSINLAYREDLWADGQLIVYLFAPTDAQLIENIKTRYPQIEKKIMESDLKQIRSTTYQGGPNRKDINRIKNGLGIEIDLPIDFKIAVLDSVNQTVWVRREVRETSSNILIKILDYTSEDLISEESIIATRNLLGKEYITTAVKGSYMTTDDVNLPVIFNQSTVNDNYTLSARGISEMEQDFMGGSFLSQMIYLEEIGKVVFLDGFLYAPEQDKRPMMQRFEVIFSTVKPI